MPQLHSREKSVRDERMRHSISGTDVGFSGVGE